MEYYWPFLEIDCLLVKCNRKEAYDALSKMERTAEVEWRMANAIYLQTEDIEDQKERREKLTEAFELAKSAFEKDPKNGQAAKQAALVVGILSESATNSLEQMKLGAQFKKYLDHTIELESEPCMLVLLMRGRFSFAVASLHWVTRFFACRVFNSLPLCTYDDALKDLHAAEKIFPSLDTLLFIGKAYLCKGDREKAREYLNRVAEEASFEEGCGAVAKELMEEAKKILTDL